MSRNNNTPASDEVLNQLHQIVARELADRIQSGEAKPADLAAAIKFLKDNDITVGKIEAGSPMADLIKQMPFPEEEATDYLN